MKTDIALEGLRSGSKRNFVQSVDLIVNLRDLNLKKPTDQLDFYANLPNVGKKIKVCAFVGVELESAAKGIFDKVIVVGDFKKYTDKRLAKKLANQYDFFVAQMEVMGKVAAVFGRVLGSRGKMPNPKAGAVFTTKTNLSQVAEKFTTIVRFFAKKEPVVKVRVGTEDMSDAALKKNIEFSVAQIIHHLPNERHNLKEVLIKTTMGKPVRVEGW